MENDSSKAKPRARRSKPKVEPESASQPADAGKDVLITDVVQKETVENADTEKEVSSEQPMPDIAGQANDAAVSSSSSESTKEVSADASEEKGQGRQNIEILEDLQVTASVDMTTGFGWISIGGKKFEYDVIIHTDGSITKRDKSLSKGKKGKYGHTPLTRRELDLLLKESPELIVIGTGQMGGMPLTPKAEKELRDHMCFIGPTSDAIKWLGNDGKKKVALVHVTC